MKIFLTFLFSLFFLCSYADTIQIKVYPCNDKTGITTYSLPRTVTANRTLVFSKYQNESGDGFQYTTIPFKGRSIDGYSYFYYIEIYYGGPSSASKQNMFLGSDQNSATGSVPVDTWRTSGYDWTYSPTSVEFRYTSGVAIIFVWEVQVPSGTAPSGSPPSDGSSGSYGTVTIPPATESNPNPLPTLSNPPEGSNPPADPENPGTGGGGTTDPDNPGTGGGGTGGGGTGGGGTGGGSTGGTTNITGNITGTITGTVNDGNINITVDNEVNVDIPPPVTLPEPPDVDDIKVDDPLQKIAEKLKPDINLPSGGSFSYPRFFIPLPKREGIVISIGDGLENTSISRAVRTIQTLTHAIGYFLITLVTFKAIIKLFRKNS